MNSVLVTILLGLALPYFATAGDKYVYKVCSQPADVGKACPEGKARTLFRFNKDTEKCEALNYLGCEGNDNKYEDKPDCVNSCQTPWFLRKNKEEEKAGLVDTHTPKDCELPKSGGDCKAIIPMWFYNTEKKACEEFTYSGCGGTANRFLTKTRCNHFCILKLF